jgi:3'-5' exoribonuclease
LLFDDNLAKLNEKLSKNNLSLENRGDELVLIGSDYPLYNLPLLKAELQEVYDLRFNTSQKYWYIGNVGIRKLSERVLKLKPSRSDAELIAKLDDFINQIENDKLKECIKKLLSENQFFYESPAAIYYHHAYKHGLLEHSVQVIELCFSMMDTFDDGISINKDLIIAGSILHDIGKINCYKFVEGGIGVCPALSEQDHIINGTKLVSQYIQCDQLDELLHIVASHHKEKTYGSPVSPISNEAWVINVADELSSKIMG